MPHAYEVKPAEKHSLLNNDKECHRRKVPRLALSMDVKTLQSSQLSNNTSWTPSSAHMSRFPSQPRVENLYLSPHGQEDGMSELEPYIPQEVELMNYKYGERHLAFHSDHDYPAFVPLAYHCPNVATMPVETSSREQPPRRLLSNAHDHSRNSKPRYSRLRPASFYPSPPQSRASSLRPVNISPSPTQPSPSLPLHQPRPFKRIPIISLSRLALACEDLAAPPIVSHKSRNEIASSDLYLSDFAPSRHLDRLRTRERRTPAESRDDDRLRRVVQCSCGCMESYAVGFSPLIHR